MGVLISLVFRRSPIVNSNCSVVTKFRPDIETRIDILRRGYIYILHSSRCPANVLKIGMTNRHIKTRVAEYPKGSKLLYSVQVPDTRIEQIILEELKAKYTKCPQFGREYFRISFEDMRKTVDTILS